MDGMDEAHVDVIQKTIFRDDDAFYTLNYFWLLALGQEKNNDPLKEVKAAIANQLDTAIDDSIRQKYLEAVPIGGGMQIGEKIFCLARKKRAGILTDFKRF